MQEVPPGSHYGLLQQKICLFEPTTHAECTQ